MPSRAEREQLVGMRAGARERRTQEWQLLAVSAMCRTSSHRSVTVRSVCTWCLTAVHSMCWTVSNTSWKRCWICLTPPEIGVGAGVLTPVLTLDHKLWLRHTVETLRSRLPELRTEDNCANLRSGKCRCMSNEAREHLVRRRCHA